MKIKQTERKNHNFTTISDYELAVKSDYQNPLGPLLYFRVLKTRELMNRMGYKHGIKSFRKKLVQWEKRKLIGRVRESPKSCYYIFPGEKLLPSLTGKRPHPS